MSANTTAAVVLGGSVLALIFLFTLGLPRCADDEVLARGLFWFVCVKG